MALISMNPDAVREYVLKEDDGPDPTVFTVGVLDSYSWAYMGRASRYGKEGDADPIGLLNTIVRFGLKGWKNFKDEKGQDIPFETEAVDVPEIGPRSIMKKELLRWFKMGWITELAREIQQMNHIEGEERKN